MSQFDALVVPGGPNPEESNLRTDTGWDFAVSHSIPRLILSGGQNEIMAQQALEHCHALVDIERRPRVYVEDQSRDTVGNAHFTKPLLMKLGAFNLAVCTSDYHVERAVWVFRKVLGEDFRVEPVSVSTQQIYEPGVRLDLHAHDQRLLTLSKLALAAVPANWDGLRGHLIGLNPRYSDGQPSTAEAAIS